MAMAHQDQDHDPPDVAGVLRILRAEFGEDAVAIDDMSATLERSIALHGEATAAVVLTSKAALSAYDPTHPERIACIAISFPAPASVSYSVVVNNREFQGASQFVRALRTTSSVASATCVVCLDGARDRKGGRLQLWMCPHCRSGVCLRCEGKMQRAKQDAGGSTHDARRCPTCRRWQLTGDDFGAPVGGRAPLQPPPGGTSLPLQPPQAGAGVDGFVDAVATLDGSVEVVLRSGLAFVGSVGFTRLAGTDRYAPGTPGRVKHVRRRLTRFVLDELRCGAAVSNVYVFRPTWRIDPTAEKPVVEASAFVLVRGTSELLQLRTDAWLDVFGDAPDAHHVKVELPGVPVADFPVPPHIRSALDAVALHALGSGAEKLTLAVEFEFANGVEKAPAPAPSPYTGFNVDAEVIADAEPSLRMITMHRLMFEATLDIHLRDGQRPSVLFAKLWPSTSADASVTDASMIAFRFDHRSCVRLGPDETAAAYSGIFHDRHK